MLPDAGAPLPAAEPTRTPLPISRRAGWGRLLAVPTPLVFVAAVAVAVALLWRRGTLADLGTAARGAEPAILVAAAACFVVGLALACLRWHVLVLMAGGRSRPPVAAEAFLTSIVVNYAAPIGLAVPTRAALSARDLGLTARASGAVALWEVALDVLVLGLVSLAWLVLAEPVPIGVGSGTLGLLVGGAVAAFLLVALGLWRRPRWRRRLGLEVAALVRLPGQRPAAAWAALALSVLYWALQALVLRLLLDAVGVGGRADAGLLLGLLGPPILVGMLSPVPGGAGVREALMVGVARASGVDGSTVLLAAVAYRASLLAAVPLLYAVARTWVRATRATGATDKGDSGD